MTVRLLTEHYLEFLSLKGGCTGSSESTLIKMPHCWKSHVTAHFSLHFLLGIIASTVVFKCKTKKRASLLFLFLPDCGHLLIF